MSSASEQKRRNLTIALGVASAVTFGGIYAAIARGSGGGTATQAAVLELDQTAYSELTNPDATVAPVSRDDDDDEDEDEEHESDDDDDDDAGDSEARAGVATATPSTGNTISPTTAPTHAPVATQQPVTKTRGS